MALLYRRTHQLLRQIRQAITCNCRIQSLMHIAKRQLTINMDFDFFFLCKKCHVTNTPPCVGERKLIQV